MLLTTVQLRVTPMVTKRGASRKSAAVPEDLQRFGTYLRELRKKRGMTQSDVAGERYSAAYVSQIESGLKEPSPAVVRYFAEQLDVDPEELWGGAPSGWVVDMAKELRSSAATPEARTLVQRTLSILETAGRVDSRAVGIVHRELGLFAMERAEAETAEKHLREAIRHFEMDEGTPTHDLAATYYALGRVCDERGDLPYAVEAYREAAMLMVQREQI